MIIDRVDDCRLLAWLRVMGLCLAVGRGRSNAYRAVVKRAVIELVVVPVQGDVDGDEVVALVGARAELLYLVRVVWERALVVVWLDLFRLFAVVRVSGEVDACVLVEFCLVDCGLSVFGNRQRVVVCVRVLRVWVCR